MLEAGDDHRPDDAVDRLLVERRSAAAARARALDVLVEARIRRPAGADVGPGRLGDAHAARTLWRGAGGFQPKEPAAGCGLLRIGTRRKVTGLPPGTARGDGGTSTRIRASTTTAPDGRGHHRVQVELGDRRVCRCERGCAHHDLRDSPDVRARRSPEPIEKRERPQAADHLVGLAGVDGRKAHGDVGQQLDGDAAGAARHDRPEPGSLVTPTSSSTPSGTIACTTKPSTSWPPRRTAAATAAPPARPPPRRARPERARPPPSCAPRRARSPSPRRARRGARPLGRRPARRAPSSRAPGGCRARPGGPRRRSGSATRARRPERARSRPLRRPRRRDPSAAERRARPPCAVRSRRPAPAPVPQPRVSRRPGPARRRRPDPPAARRDA